MPWSSSTLTAHRLALDPAALAFAVARTARPALRSVADQLVRAATSVAANLAEGAGRTGRDRQHHWHIAYGGALEAVAITSGGRAPPSRPPRALPPEPPPLAPAKPDARLSYLQPPQPPPAQPPRNRTTVPVPVTVPVPGAGAVSAGAGYTPGVRTATSSIPVVASLLAVGYLLASLAWWWLLPTVAAAASVAACALVLTRRPNPRLVRSLAMIGAWLGVGFAGAWWLRGAPGGGLGWVLAVLFVAPLPIIPWLYTRSFADHHDGEREGTS